MTISTLILAAFLASGQLITMDTRDMDLSDFFRFIGKITDINVVLHPAIQGKVNLMVNNAPWEQVLDSVLKNYGLEKEIDGNVMRIAPAGTFETSLETLPLHTQVYFLKYARAEDVALVVSKLLSPRGSVVAYTPRNALIVTDVVRSAQPQR
jgi:type II secretory pathway component GspD/PulD (secretin)